MKNSTIQALLALLLGFVIITPLSASHKRPQSLVNYPISDSSENDSDDEIVSVPTTRGPIRLRKKPKPTPITLNSTPDLLISMVPVSGSAPVHQTNITDIDSTIALKTIVPFLDLASKAALSSTQKSFKLFISEQIKQVTNKIVFPFGQNATNPSTLSDPATTKLILSLAPKKILTTEYPVNTDNKYIVSVSMVKKLLLDSAEANQAEAVGVIVAKEIKRYENVYKKALEDATSTQAACDGLIAAKSQFDETRDEFTRMALRFAWLHRANADLDTDVPLSLIINDELEDAEGGSIETNTTLNFEPINNLPNREELSCLIINFATNRLQLSNPLFNPFSLTLTNCILPLSYEQEHPIIIQTYQKLCLINASCCTSLENIFAPKLRELILQGQFPNLVSTGEPFIPLLNVFGIYPGEPGPAAPILPNLEKIMLNAPGLYSIDIGVAGIDGSLHTNMPKLTSTNINEINMPYIRHQVDETLDDGFSQILTTINHNNPHQAPAAALLMADHNAIAPAPEDIEAEEEEALQQIAANAPVEPESEPDYRNPFDDLWL